MGQKLVPYHAFRDPGVRWETSDAFNAPARVRASGGGQCPNARRLSVRSSPLPSSTVVVARALTDSLDAISVFEAATVDGGAYVRLERRIKGLDLRTGNLIMRIAEGTPY